MSMTFPLKEKSVAEVGKAAEAKRLRNLRAARISAARLIVNVNKKLGEPTDPEIVELSKQTA